MRMTAKQRLFCDEYIIDFNATQAAIRAGYSKKTAGAMGAENLTKPVIQECIKQRTEEADAQRVASGNEVLEYLTSVMRGDDEAEIVVVADGIPCVEGYSDQRNRIKAAELLAKSHGLMVQRVDMSDVQVTIVDDLAQDDG